MNADSGGATTIDWSGPWYAPWRHPGCEVQQHVQSGLAPWDALNRVGAAPVRFIPPDQAPSGTSYEQFVANSGTCPTRNGLHDFFNGLCWINFPATKRTLNDIHVTQITAPGASQQHRGRVRDAATLFDEGGALLHAPDILWEALAAKQWVRLFVELRPLWREAHLVVFGHALLAKLATPRKELTAHVYRTHAKPYCLAALDSWTAQALGAANLAVKPFVPLPVLGIPGWWASNENMSFYDDQAVFRAPRPPP